MIASLFDLLFGCRHGRCSFPITARTKQRTGAALVTGTYVVCLDCGKEFAYDWQNMQVVREADLSSAAITGVAESFAGK